MLCYQARRRLNRFNWRYSDYSLDTELMEHLRKCSGCGSLVQADDALHHDLDAVRREEPPYDLALDAVRAKTENAGSRRCETGLRADSHPIRPAAGLAYNARRRLAVGAVVVLFGLIALIPFDLTEKVGYRIAVAGVDRSIALDNHKIASLLGALGMEKDKATTLLDSIEINEIQLSVGECRETCHLTISDLKTEKDVRLVVQAIIDLGCCQIDDISPIFRNQSTSLLRLAARKLFS
jgi:hypothetical protein